MALQKSVLFRGGTEVKSDERAALVYRMLTMPTATSKTFQYPLLLPLRKIVPGYAGVDFACVVLALLVQMIGTELLVFLKYGGFVGIVPLLVASLFGLLTLLLKFYFFARFRKTPY